MRFLYGVFTLGMSALGAMIVSPHYFTSWVAAKDPGVILMFRALLFIVFLVILSRFAPGKGTKTKE